MEACDLRHFVLGDPRYRKPMLPKEVLVALGVILVPVPVFAIHLHRQPLLREEEVHGVWTKSRLGHHHLEAPEEGLISPPSKAAWVWSSPTTYTPTTAVALKHVLLNTSTSLISI